MGLLPLLENINKRYNIIDLLQVLKLIDELDSTKILKIKNLLVPINNTISAEDIRNVLYSLGSNRSLIDKILSKLEEHDIENQ